MLERIFLIDDDPITNFVNEHIITELKVAHQVEIFTEAENALSLIKNESSQDKGSDLILLDLNMPHLDGFDFIEAFQQLDVGKASKYRIIVLTSSKHSRDLQRLATLGIKEVLNKPLTKEKMLSIV
ncbi:response regulator of citrate/malate metabolism [Catalinimonas alkaloidigena]|uniref:response regulator n=1 Tax=Catalinimonas alkaloidigena TaxID=1075417 RepID=UPI002406C993|nr:response regulator [Catalinimonas alkaloidigena]MDF9798831.1 response regulator of citrate/malate metabolism [Catalinimonas alkaloidigena]